MSKAFVQHARTAVARLGVVGVVAVLLIAAAAALTFDLSVQQAATARRPPGLVRDYFKATEAFGNGFGVAMILVAVTVLDRTRRVQTFRLLTASLGAGLLADAVKMTVGRSRPNSTAIGDLLAAGGTSFDTFLGVLPWTSLGSGGQSFPSAHTATAVGLAVALASAYPGARRMWFAFAAGVALQRVCVGAHFLSDVLAGAALGAAWGHLCWGRAFAGQGAIAVVFDRVEAWWSQRFGWPLPDRHAALATPANEEGPTLLAMRSPVADASIRRAA